MGLINKAKNAAYIKRLGLYELAESEKPKYNVSDFAVTESFVWGKDGICVPISEISSVRHSKSGDFYCGLWVKTFDGKRFRILGYCGFNYAKHITTVRFCFSKIKSAMHENKTV